MKLTPLDIEQQQFKQIMRGWDPEEVRRFLQQVGDRVEELIRENTGLRDDVRRLEQQVAEFRSHEGQLRQALVSAGRMGEEIKESARKEAELLRAEAELQAEKIVRSARDDVVRYAEQARELRLQKARVLGELRTVVDAHRRLLDTHEMLDREDESRRAAEADEVRKAGRLRLAEAPQVDEPAESPLPEPGSRPLDVSPLRTAPRSDGPAPRDGGLSEAGLFGDGEAAPIARPTQRPVSRSVPGRPSVPPPGRRLPPPPGRSSS